MKRSTLTDYALSFYWKLQWCKANHSYPPEGRHWVRAGEIYKRFTEWEIIEE